MPADGHSSDRRDRMRISLPRCPTERRSRASLGPAPRTSRQGAPPSPRARSRRTSAGWAPIGRARARGLATASVSPSSPPASSTRCWRGPRATSASGATCSPTRPRAARSWPACARPTTESCRPTGGSTGCPSRAPPSRTDARTGPAPTSSSGRLPTRASTSSSFALTRSAARSSPREGASSARTWSIARPARASTSPRRRSSSPATRCGHRSSCGPRRSGRPRSGAISTTTRR